MAHMKVIECGQVVNNVSDDPMDSAGTLADIPAIQRLNPRTAASHINLYREIMFGPSSLKRYQCEMLGVVVSVVNECEYCLSRHRHALLQLWREEWRVEALITGDSTDLSEEDSALCAFARRLTLVPAISSDTRELKALGLADRAILDATLVVAYFNFMNRLVLGTPGASSGGCPAPCDLRHER